MNKTVIYTALFGDNVRLYPQPKVEGADFICFSDRIHHTRGWRVIKVDPPYGNDLTRSNRYYKILPHLSLPEYEYSIYIDGNIILFKSPLELIQNGLKDCNMLVFNHAETTKDPRNCIYEEYQAILALAEKRGVFKDDPAIMQAQIDFIRSKAYPADKGLIKGGVLIRRHKEADVIKTMERWWYFIENYSKRDQLSFNFAAWETNLDFEYLPGDLRRGNPWFYMISKNDKNPIFSLLKYSLRKVWASVSSFKKEQKL